MKNDIRGPVRVVPWHRRAWRLLGVFMMLVAGLPGLAGAQDTPFKDEELDQMLAPIALYPDSLLSQVLMAATYPADVKEAADWSKAHPDAKGDAAVKQVEKQEWEPAVQSLVAFPQVLAMMRDKPADVQRLGDAFLADPGRVMDRVQVLRKKAQQAGNLKTNEQQKVSVQTEAAKQVIVIEPAQPQVVYVPVYQPSVVYGAWAYPSYPPFYWPPPPYYYPPSSGAFVAGVFWGVAISGINNCLWGGFGWGRGNVNINVNHYNNINVNKRITNNNNTFVHNADRRRDVPYRDSKSREQFGKKQLDGAKDREAFRGKEGGRDAGRDADRSKAADTLKSRGADPAAGREKLQGADRDKAANAVRDADRSRAGSGGAGNRSADRAAPSSALSGVRDSGASRANADRGRASSQSMSQRPSGGGGGGAARTSGASARGAGGAARAGGGGGGGGGRHR